MKKYVFPVFFLVFLFACKKKESNTPIGESHQMNIEIQSKFGAQTMYLDSIYSTTNGDKIKFTLFKVLMENIQFSGKTIQSASYNCAEGNDLLSIKGKPVENDVFSANLGVDSTLNHNDPTQFPTESPLNILNANDMHWSWSPGYIFFKIEAKMDTIDDGNDNFDHFVTYHIGRDENLRTLNLPTINWESLGENHKLILNFDFEKFISNGSSTINLRADNISHSGAGQQVLSTQIANNFKNAFSN